MISPFYSNSCFILTSDCVIFLSHLPEYLSLFFILLNLTCLLKLFKYMFLLSLQALLILPSIFFCPSENLFYKWTCNCRERVVVLFSFYFAHFPRHVNITQHHICFKFLIFINNLKNNLLAFLQTFYKYCINLKYLPSHIFKTNAGAGGVLLLLKCYKLSLGRLLIKIFIFKLTKMK